MDIAGMNTQKLEKTKSDIDLAVETIRSAIGRDDPSARLLEAKSLAIAAEIWRRKARQSRPAEFPSKLWIVHRDEEESQGVLGAYTTERQADAALAYMRAESKYCDFGKTVIEVDAPPRDWT